MSSIQDSELMANLYATVKRLCKTVQDLTTDHSTLQEKFEHYMRCPNMTTNASQYCIPNFKLSIKPLDFHGNIKHMPAHRLQNYLVDYLERSLETCKLYNFASEPTNVTHIGQPTYVQFVFSGLSDQSRTAWQHIPTYEHKNMTWDNYRKWILTTF
ncbi:hypothetical protein HDU84_009645, partial [Entophlyctis sp. JEL0112]